MNLKRILYLLLIGVVAVFSAAAGAIVGGKAVIARLLQER